MARRIDDRLAGLEGRFEGTARFAWDGDWLVCQEKGELSFAGIKPMAGTRTYLWREGEGGIDVHFEDERFFHRIGTGASPEAGHWCDPDRYDVAYDFADWPNWQATWTVMGPRKNYKSTSYFSRA